MIAEQLKKAVLQAAIQGKLTEQRPEDGDVRDLLKEIRAEEARLLKDEKLKKEKPLPEISEDEIPFDIPENWVWVRLGSVAKITNGFTPLRSNQNFWNSKDIPWFTVSDLRSQGHIITSTEQYISKLAISSNDRIVPANSVLLCCTSATIGEYAYTKIDLTTNQQFNALTIKPEYEGWIASTYLFYLVQNLDSELKRKAGITTFPFLSTTKLSLFLIPLPPPLEQHRIVDQLDLILPEIEKLEADESKLEALQKAFPQQLKKSILQSAIQGKLTDQRPEDGDAHDLLKEIQQEKAKLIKAGKLKKGKPLPPIVEDDIPFDIPDNWEWCRINEIVWLGNGEKKTKKKLPYLEAKVLRGQKESTYRTSGEVVFEGDRIILVDGENSGEVFDVLYEGYLGSTFKKLMFVSDSVIPYTLFFLKKYQTLFKNNKTGSAIPHLNKTLFKELLIPLPPVDEQLRIIDRLEQLLPLCEKLE